MQVLIGQHDKIYFFFILQVLGQAVYSNMSRGIILVGYVKEMHGKWPVIFGCDRRYVVEATTVV